MPVPLKIVGDSYSMDFDFFGLGNKRNRCKGHTAFRDCHQLCFVNVKFQLVFAAPILHVLYRLQNIRRDITGSMGNDERAIIRVFITGGRR